MDNQEKIKYKHLPLVLIIMDGWGITAPNKGNAITLAKTPVISDLSQNYPCTTIHAHGSAVGLPKDQDGNSEAGHMNLGAGRVVFQDTMTVTNAIENGQFAKNPAFKAAVEHVHYHNSAIHLMGLLTGWESAHADPDHLIALMNLLHQNNVKKVYLHLFTDGRDSYKYGALEFYRKIRENMKHEEKIASVSGRYYSMDRNKKWDRTEVSYKMLSTGKSEYTAESFEQAIDQAYRRGETDEFIKPTVIVDQDKKPVGVVNDNDAIIFFNLRSDRTRQITKPFTQNDFNKSNPGSFKRSHVVKNLVFVAMTDFGPDLDNILTAFPSVDVKDTLPMVLKDLRQLYIAETEKYAHVTYFFNGGYDHAVGGEEWCQVPSPAVKSYDLEPGMSARKVTDKVIERLKDKDFICVNFANPDMVGHTGNLEAGIKSVEVVDECVGRIVETVVSLKGAVVITADHGNVEEMINLETGEIDTQHSSNPVPFIIADHTKSLRLSDNGKLGDVAPTILELIGIEKPHTMTGKSLIIKN